MNHSLCILFEWTPCPRDVSDFITNDGTNLDSSVVLFANPGHWATACMCRLDKPEAKEFHARISHQYQDQDYIF